MQKQKKPKGFVGFVRVSTERQADTHDSMHSQRLALEDYAKQFSLPLHIVAAIEPGHGPSSARLGYHEAIRQAKEQSFAILVANPSRLSRSVEDLVFIDFRKTPVWVAGEGRIEKKPLISEVQRAADELTQLKADGSLGGKKRNLFPNTEDARKRKRDGQLRGGSANAERAFRNRSNVQHFMTQHGITQETTHQQLADALNAAGIENCTKEKPPTYEHWTAQALRPVRKAVVEQIALDDLPFDDLTSSPSESTLPDALTATLEPQTAHTATSRAEPHQGPAGALLRALTAVKRLLRKTLAKLT